MDLLKSLSYPEEVLALVRYKMSSVTATKMVGERELTGGMKKCYEYLRLTSRSFAAVIQALDAELRDAVCIFYLVLRALDTVEDDMAINVDNKISLLREFYTCLEQPEWKFCESQEKDRIVLEDFPVISGEYRRLSEVYREVISDICRRMGNGMTVYLSRAPYSIEEWNEYCHYVAGLVGLGLTHIFTGSGLEDPEMLSTEEGLMLANSMGLFLQKTNIIRDYLEDVRQDRLFWPKQVWGKYVKDLVDFSFEENSHLAVQCLNELITNALLHIPHVLEYLSRLNNQSVFNFCAIPQVMAIATLERCYNNLEVFRGVVKIRKGEAIRLMLSATNIDSVKSIFKHFTSKIKERIPSDCSTMEHNADISAHSATVIVNGNLSVEGQCCQTGEPLVKKTVTTGNTKQEHSVPAVKTLQKSTTVALAPVVAATAAANNGALETTATVATATAETTATADTAIAGTGIATVKKVETEVETAKTAATGATETTAAATIEPAEIQATVAALNDALEATKTAAAADVRTTSTTTLGNNTKQLANQGSTKIEHTLDTSVTSLVSKPLFYGSTTSAATCSANGVTSSTAYSNPSSNQIRKDLGSDSSSRDDVRDASATISAFTATDSTSNSNVAVWPIGTLEVVNKALLVSRTAAVYSSSSSWAEYLLTLPILLSLVLIVVALLWSGASTYNDSALV